MLLNSINTTNLIFQLNAPLEQFEILTIINNGLFLFNLTNIHYYYLVILVIFFVLSNSTFFNKLHNNNKYNIYFVLSFIYNELGIITLRNINVKIGQRYFTLLFFIFLFLLTSNLIGMIPYSFTITSHVLVTFTLSFIIFFAINFIAISDVSWNFFTLFLPPGAPFVITPFLVIIEFISYIARVFSLAIRLFANMMAGHTLLKILISFSFMIIFSNLFENWPLMFVGFIIFFLVYVISFLEIAIALLQGYVFIVLLCLYIKDLYIAH